MLKGIIFVKDTIISLDLKILLSKYYKIVNVFKNIESASYIEKDIDFIIIDTDPFTEEELRIILKKVNINDKVKIISITSYTDEFSKISYVHESLKKPFDYQKLISAITKD